MPKILLGISIVLMAATAFFGFSTKSKMQDITKQVGEAKQAESTAKQDAADERKKTEEAEKLAAKAKQDAESLTSDLKKVQDEALAAKNALASANAEVADLKTKLAAAGTGTPTEQTAAAPNADKVKDLETKLAETEAKAKESETLVATLTNKVQEVQKAADDLSAKERARQQGLMQKGLEGKVMAVNQAWNFVVLNIGDRQGVVPTANMVVMRDGQMVARVKVSSVEPGSSVADVIPGSTAKGTRVLPGDRVIFPGS